ncbi:MAG: glutamate--tRNA ligase [Candidatus Altimarinota bacterium]
MVRTRLAPSPTGYLHIGSLRTALYCYLWAKKNHGQYIVRIEDTDRTRLVEGAVEAILETHHELGIMPDEGPHHDGGYGPYTQSERLKEYAPRLHKLCDDGTAYYCFCSSERLDALKKEQEELKLPPKYDGHCRHIPLEEARERIENGEKFTIRLKVPKGETIIFQDLIRGRIEFKTSEIDDQVLLKSDGEFPTYHGAIVIDDHLMGITHVMRGEEWISSIPKQVLTARALGIELPLYAHLPNVLGADGKKLSKRTGDVSVSEYLKKGYFPEALLNFLALLGWHPKQDEEIMSMQTMIEKFEITDIHKSGAILDPVKLDWMNGEYIKKMDIGELHERLASYLKRYEPEFYEGVFSQQDFDYNARIIREVQGRMKKLDEFRQLTLFIYGGAEIKKNLLVNPKMKIESEKEGIEALQFVLPLLENADFSSLDSLKGPILESIAQSGKKNGQILWPLRVALSGEEFSPGAFELAFILGKEKCIERIGRYFV